MKSAAALCSWPEPFHARGLQWADLESSTVTIKHFRKKKRRLMTVGMGTVNEDGYAEKDAYPFPAT